jgi:LEA14-like dessication related protein
MKNLMKNLPQKIKIVPFLILSAYLSSCASLDVHPVAAPSTDSIKAEWIKKNQKAPFSGILMNDNTYRLMRSKIIECQYQLNMCIEDK